MVCSVHGINVPSIAKTVCAPRSHGSSLIDVPFPLRRNRSLCNEPHRLVMVSHDLGEDNLAGAVTAQPDPNFRNDERHLPSPISAETFASRARRGKALPINPRSSERYGSNEASEDPARKNSLSVGWDEVFVPTL